MSDPILKTKKHTKRRGSVTEGRRRSSVSQIEDVVNAIMEAESGGLCLSSKMEKYETDFAKADLKEEYKGERRFARFRYLHSQLRSSFCYG